MATGKLLAEFPPVSTELWEEAIAKDLKGEDYARKLIWQTEEGMAVKPYYRADDIAGLDYLTAVPGDFPYVRGACLTGDWRIREEIDETDPEKANQAAQSAVAAGAEEIAFSRVAVGNATVLEILLRNLVEIPVHFEQADEPLLRLLMARVNVRPMAASVATGFDPLTKIDFAAEVLHSASAKLAPFTIHGEEFEESGANAVEEVGFTLAAGVDFLAGMQARDIDVSRAATAVKFNFAMGANFFFQIAKLRAFRMVWAQAVESFGASRGSAAARIHARTSHWTETIYDPHVNILRGTTEAMSAVLGGADSISVAPFDECYKRPDAASRRLARNTQILLKHEALLSCVSDAGAGSYYIEAITEFIAREGWTRMQAIEAAGGYGKAKADGVIARALGQSLADREKAVVSRRRVFTGTNQYANVSEIALDRIDFSQLTNKSRGTLSYEMLRLRTERHAAKTGKTPRVLLAEFGDAKMRSARSNFAANFFACAGFEIDTKRFSSGDEIAASHSDLIVLCSSDPEYSAMAADLLRKLKAVEPETPVLVAGNPDSAEQLRAVGVADFIHIRSNPIELLTTWQQRLGIRG
jgi:methylmalonyl-CoA mutase